MPYYYDYGCDYEDYYQEFGSELLVDDADWSRERDSYLISMGCDEFDDFDRPEDDRFEDLSDAFTRAAFQELARDMHAWGWEDCGRARPRGKATTLRSWRNEKSRGGSISRKAIARKMDHRRPLKRIIIVPFDGASGVFALG